MDKSFGFNLRYCSFDIPKSRTLVKVMKRQAKSHDSSGGQEELSLESRASFAACVFR